MSDKFRIPIDFSEPERITYFLIDIDSTLSDPTARLHYLQRNPKDYDGFYDPMSMLQDPPILRGLEAMKALGELANVAKSRFPYRIVFATGRPERCRGATKIWLKQYVDKLIPNTFSFLFMREDGNYQQGWEIKDNLLRRLKAMHPNATFYGVDDDYKILEAYAKRRCITYKVPECWQDFMDELFFLKERELKNPNTTKK